MIRTKGISTEYSRDENEQIRRHYNGKAILKLDEYGFIEYGFHFSSSLELDCMSINKEVAPAKIQVADLDVTDLVYNTLVKEFAVELARRMKYTNYKNLEMHGINPGMIIWDENNPIYKT